MYMYRNLLMVNIKHESVFFHRYIGNNDNDNDI